MRDDGKTVKINVAVKKALYSVRITLHVSAKNGCPSSGRITRIQKGVRCTNLFQV